MKNTLTDLNNYLFAQIERLNDESMSDEEMDREIKRSGAITGIAKVVIDNGNLALKTVKHMAEYNPETKIDAPLLGIKSDEKKNA